jgi:hypothetical protein
VDTILNTYVFGTLGTGIAVISFILSLGHSLRHHNFHATTITSLAIMLWFGARTIWSTLGLGSF